MKEIKIFAIGDLYISDSKYKLINDELVNIIDNHDIKFCNLEAPITLSNNKIYKAGPCLKQSESVVKFIKKYNFNIISIANNHIFDYGNDGLSDTIKILNDNMIDFIGAGLNENEAYEAKIKEINGIKIGFIAASEWQFGVYDDINCYNGGSAWINSFKIDRLILETKQKVDILVLSVHAGAEDVPLPLKQWRKKYKSLIDLGVDIIIGHHTHVAQGYEYYNNKLIIYSLGNGIFNYGNYKYEKNNSYAASITIDSNKNIKLNIIPISNINNILLINNKEEFIDKIKILNAILENESLYNKLILQQNTWLFYNNYKRYFYNYTNTEYNCKKKTKKVLLILKEIIKDLINYKRDSKYNSMILYHLLKVESHRYVIQDALLNEYQYKNFDVYDFKELLKNIWE